MVARAAAAAGWQVGRWRRLINGGGWWLLVSVLKRWVGTGSSSSVVTTATAGAG